VRFIDPALNISSHVGFHLAFVRLSSLRHPRSLLPCQFTATLLVYINRTKAHAIHTHPSPVISEPGACSTDTRRPCCALEAAVLPATVAVVEHSSQAQVLREHRVRVGSSSSCL
jgi:hypothetical protein